MLRQTYIKATDDAIERATHLCHTRDCSQLLHWANAAHGLGLNRGGEVG